MGKAIVAVAQWEVRVRLADRRKRRRFSRRMPASAGFAEEAGRAGPMKGDDAWLPVVHNDLPKNKELLRFANLVQAPSS